MVHLKFMKIALNGNFNVYTTECDLAKVGVTALNGFIWAPRGCQLGRLVEDPGRRAFATFYAHAHCNGSHNLGGDIRENSFVFLGEKALPVYDGRHLLNMPIAMSNGSVLQIKNSATIIGPFMNKGILSGPLDPTTGKYGVTNLILDSRADISVWEAGIVEIKENCEITGQVVIKRNITTFDFTYITGGWEHHHRTANFCNSDAGVLKVYGNLYGNAIINNEACIFDVKQTSPEVHINSKDFISSLYQQFISGATEDIASLSAVTASGRKIHINAAGMYGCLPYALGFLSKTNNFQNA